MSTTATLSQQKRGKTKHRTYREISAERSKRKSPLEKTEIGNRGKLLANANHSWETMKGEIPCQTTLLPSLLNSVEDNPLPDFSILSV
jgi:hypothetical protein